MHMETHKRVKSLALITYQKQIEIIFLCKFCIRELLYDMKRWTKLLVHLSPSPLLVYKSADLETQPSVFTHNHFEWAAYEVHKMTIM